jgi:predicted hydrocarbon binding protein
MEVAEKSVRSELGDFMSAVCFKSAVTGMEEALGDKAAAIALIAAGRQRGKRVAEAFNLVNQGNTLSLEEIRAKLDFALGKEGTRLCIIDKIEQDGETFVCYTRETVCSINEPEGSPRRCTYTLGAIQGFLEALLGKRLRGRHTESVLRGSNHDVLVYSPLI